MISLHEEWAQQMTLDSNEAEHSIIISAISLLPPRSKSTLPWPRLWASWVAASQRGVHVCFILPVPASQHPATWRNAQAAEAAYKEGIQTRWVPQPRLLHAKTLVIDEKLCYVGSGNMTAAAAHQNHEFYVRFEDQEIARQIQQRWGKIARD